MAFEKNISKLEGIVKELEDDNTSLEYGIEIYEKGIGLVKDCLAELKNQQSKVTILQKEIDKLTEIKFDEEI